MNASASGQWKIAERAGHIRIKTSRIGFLSVNADAPVLGGSVTVTPELIEIEFHVGIGEVSTGSHLLDPEVHALVHRGSDGVLRFQGTGPGGASLAFTGTAKAGNIEVPLTLDAAGTLTRETKELPVAGLAVFEDISLPLPGMGHIDHLDVHIEGLLDLASV